ncbi:CopM family metallochaperone [Azospirillum rugosum]|uniref:DUF305 domain-containing protein n=1 Tax=Azospirillum rugosum TaxID=416170 RepID=A0ABS4SJF6_9PROT|nr:DUF305 domain-containing protein [Azospirillum rugosum]MBP2292696.1 hypothetical protein [Azospirillum rugosum]MDQ0526280.1 hypothetical protein [Azospirillum rugosum]
MAHRVRSIVVPLAVATALIAGPAAAQQPQAQPAPQGQTTAPMGGPGMGGPGMGANQGMMQGQGMHQGQRAQAMPKDPASRAYMESMRKMNRDMHRPMTGDADQDFARMMAAHHQGAIDMARVQLRYGKDPDLKAMAQKVVEDQTKEVQQLQDWMKQHPAKQASSK